MGWILSAQAQIHEVHAMLAAPNQSAKNHADVRAEPPVKNLDRVQLGFRRFFANGARDSRAVPQPIDGVRAFASQSDFHGAGDVADMRMAGMDAAIDNRDLHAESSYVITLAKAFTIIVRLIERLLR